MKKKLASILLCLCCGVGFAACQPAPEDPTVLFCFARNESDAFGGEVYSSAVAASGCNFRVLPLGSNAATYADDVAQALAEGNYRTVVIAGDEAYAGLSDYVKSYKGMDFVALDCKLMSVRSNVAAVEFSPEELGYLGGRLTAEGADCVGYLSETRNAFDNRILYGFLQGAGDADVVAKYVEERSNVVKAKDYAVSMYQSGAERIFDCSGRNALGSLDGAAASGGRLVYSGVDLYEAADMRADALSAIDGGVEKNYAAAMKYIQNMVHNGFETGSSVFLTAADGAFLVNDSSAEEIAVKRMAGNEADFEACRKNSVMADTEYTPQYTVEAAYHEAVPSCADTNDWKYAPRAGSGNGMKPLGWKGIGIWSTIYLQEGQEPVSNTGIEFQNMRLWAYTRSSGWKLLEHANPTGSFYDEDFSQDAHTSFLSNYINYGAEKRTRIKLDYATLGYNYHPFGSQIDLVEAGFLETDGSVKNGETLYILSEMDIRLCVWDAALPSDIENAKYVANIGADWWREKGLQWTPDWNSNKDVCVGQFRTITPEWKKLYMTNVPAAEYEEVFATFPFDQEQ